MKKRLIALCFYTLFWLVYFFFARLYFLSAQYQSSLPNSFTDLMGTFWHGSKLDISTTGYYLLIPVLLAIYGVWFNGNWYKVFIRWYTYFLIVFSSIIVVSDANLYSYWGFRMDYTPMLYLKTPKEAMASVSTFRLFMLIITIVLIVYIFIYVYKRLIDKLFSDFERFRLWYLGMLFFTILLGSLIIPIRGGFGLAPINAGTVYFSNKMFLNHASINAIWNVGTSAFTQKPVKNPYEFTDLDSATELFDNLTYKKGGPEVILNNKRPNILIIVLESFSGYLIGPMGGDSLVTPNFNRYAREGVFFDNFYASGTRTDKAIPAILNGYPAQPAQSIIKEPKKSQSLPSIVKILIENGYNSSFWYGGEINFANFNSFVIGSGFRSIITKNNFSSDNYNSKWGVHDHVLFRILEDSMKNVKEPFLNVVLTLSSHEPFDVPMEPVIAGDDYITKYKNSVYYADKSLGAFLDEAKQSDWWKNTLVILVADHGARITPDILNYSPEIFRIPMLWIGGALKEKGIINSKFGSQVDIPETLLGQMEIKGDFPFGKDLFSDESGSWAFYTYNEGFAFISDSSMAIYDHKLKSTFLKEGKDPEYAEKEGKAYLQILFNDYLKR